MDVFDQDEQLAVAHLVLLPRRHGGVLGVDLHLHAGRCRHPIDVGHKLVLGKLVIDDHDSVRRGLLQPFDDDLAVDQTEVDPE